MTGYLKNIEEITLKNEYFRQVLFTGQHAQLVVMSLKPNEEIGMETHEIVDQFLRIEAGEGKVIMNGEEHPIKDGDAFVVPAGTEHNVINTSAENPLKLYTVYSPPHHKDGIVHKTKQEAEADKEDHLFSYNHYMDIKKLTDEVEKVSLLYSEKFTIKRDSDWFILKLQEELGELIQSYLMMVGQARKKEKTEEELIQNFHKEVADVFSHVLLLAKHHNVDLEKEVKEKWLIWNKS